MTQASESEPGPEGTIKGVPEPLSITLPPQLLAQANRLASAEGTTLEQLTVTAIAHYAGFLEGRAAGARLGLMNEQGVEASDDFALPAQMGDLVSRLASNMGLDLSAFGVPPQDIEAIDATGRRGERDDMTRTEGETRRADEGSGEGNRDRLA